MITPFIELFQSSLAVFAPALVLASQTFLTPLPQDISYKSLALGQIYNSNLSTNVTRQGKVAGDVAGSCSDGIDNDGNGAIDAGDSNCFGPLGYDPLGVEAPPAKLEIQLIRTPTCVLSGDLLTYKIVLTNVGGRSAVDIETQNQHPMMPIANVKRPMDRYIEAQRLMIWDEPILAPGDSITYSFQIPHILDRVRDDLTVSYYDRLSENTKIGPYVVQTYDFAKDPCPAPIAGQTPPLVTYTPIPKGPKPAIICDPAETSCAPSQPTNVGPRYGLAKSAEDGPDLGPRYNEAIADIIPGECRVIPDDIISTPEYQDALSRHAQPAAFFIRPLFDSGQDFKQLVEENSLLGISNTINAKEALLSVQQQYWERHNDIIKDVEGKVITGQQGISQLKKLFTQWQNTLTQTQQNLSRDYITMQDQRKTAFEPIAEQAVTNAIDSIARSCPEPKKNDDGGLEKLLIPVKDAYEKSLTRRTQAYAATQQTFATLTPAKNHWEQELYPALEAFDQKNTAPLDSYKKNQASYSQDTFQQLFTAYEDQAAQDKKSDEDIRLNQWEKALDKPKTVATDCQKEKDFSYHVATTWCESGDYPQLLSTPAAIPQKVKDDQIALPDTRSLDGFTAKIDPNATTGQACSKEPGDPWWASDCSCECGDIVPRDGPDPEHPIFVACESAKEITRHDYFVTTQAECLNELNKEKGTKDTFPPF
jgi:hypothetical protein